MTNDFSKMQDNEEGLLQLHCNGESETAFVFIHGFTATSSTTWGTKEQNASEFWPVQLGVRENASVYAYNYKNSQFQESHASMSIEHVASDLAKEIYEKLNKFSALVFFTHSFGGLLFKQLYISMLQGDPGIRDISKKITGFCAFSCPNFGNPFGLISMIPLSTFNFKVLRSGSAFLRDLDVEFCCSVRSTNHPLKILTFSEFGRLYMAFRVDPKTSKFPYLRDLSTDVDCPQNHQKISKDVLSDPKRNAPLCDYLTQLKDNAPAPFSIGDIP